MSATGTMPAATTARSMARASPTASSSLASGERTASGACIRVPRGARPRRCGSTTIARPPPAPSSGCGRSLCLSNRPRPHPGLFPDGGRLLGPFEQLDRMTRHDRRDRVFVDQLRVPVATQKDAEIIEPGHDALQLNPVDQEDRERSFVLSDMVQEGVLEIL